MEQIERRAPKGLIRIIEVNAGEEKVVGEYLTHFAGNAIHQMIRFNNDSSGVQSSYRVAFNDRGERVGIPL